MRITFTVNDSTYQQLAALAHAANRSISSEVRGIVMHFAAHPSEYPQYLSSIMHPFAAPAGQQVAATRPLVLPNIINSAQREALRPEEQTRYIDIGDGEYELLRT